MTDELLNYIKQQTDADLFSGAVLVAKDDKVILQYVSGYANKEKQILNDINTKFNLGSANKMFTGVAIAQLVENGKLSFQDTIGKHIPSYPNKTVAEKVTIHQLLTHTSGLGHYLNEKFMEARTKLKTIDDFIALFVDEPLLFEPGEKCSYSANGYTLLGKIIEVISGQSYYDFVRENVLLKASMPNTDSYEIDSKNLKPDIAIGYTRRIDIQGNMRKDGDRIDNLWINLIKGEAGGGGYSTCSDLLNFSLSLMDNKLLSPEMTKTVLTPYVFEGTKDGQSKNEGYGFQVWDINGVRRIGHPGKFPGVNVRFDVYPDLGYTVIVMANYDPPAAFDIAEKAMEFIIKSS
jgi:CubicO group peptidase (beta-lactamase class C family)